LATLRLQSFQADLPHNTSRQMYHAHVRDASPCVLTADGVSALFERFNKYWGIRVDGLRLVGSAQNGFSIKPGRRWQSFDFDTSDIDVAIISPELFDDMWIAVHTHMQENRYWPRIDDFRAYLFDGWIRPDVLPRRQAKEWFEFFGSFERDGLFRSVGVRAALYPREHFLESYQCGAIDMCREPT
jgi:hypothetical protein